MWVGHQDLIVCDSKKEKGGEAGGERWLGL